MKEYRDLVLEVQNFLKNLAEDKDLPIDKKVYDMLWNEIQSIDKSLAELWEEAKQIINRS